MPKTFLAALVALLLSIGAVSAQTNTTPINTAIEEIRLAVVKNVGSQDKQVEVVRTGNVLTISRVNSNMNGRFARSCRASRTSAAAPPRPFASSRSLHQLVNNEATSIAMVVSNTIGDKSEFKGLHTIRVQYLNRSGSTVKNKVIDSVEFRKGKNGKFEIHST